MLLEELSFLLVKTSPALSLSPEEARQTVGRGGRFSDRSYERWVALESLSLQGRLTFDDPFQDFGAEGSRLQRFYTKLGTGAPRP